MADHLTIDGRRSTREGTAQQTGEGDARETAELDRLRTIAERHHGRELDDKTLQAMVARRKAKIAKSQARDAAAREFQKGQAREQVSHEVAEQETQARRAIGAQKARGASAELTAKNSRQVRSNPLSEPQLPPTLDKATTAEQAARLIDKMFGFVTVDGEAFDAKAYSETLRQAPASQQQSAPRSRQQTPRPLRQQTQPPGQQKTAKQQPDPSVQKRSQQPAKLGQLAGNTGNANLSNGRTSTAMPHPPSPWAPETSRAEVGRPAAPLTISSSGASATARTGTPDPNSLSGGTGVSADGLFNAGGGLITHSSFDGMRFNWEAFNWFFTMVVMKDLHKHRRELKELRRAQGEAAIAGMRLKLAIANMRQVSERNKSTVTFFEQVKSAVGTANSERLKAEAKDQVGQAEKQREENRAEQENAKAGLQELREGRAQLEEQLQAPEVADRDTTLDKVDQNIGELEGELQELVAEEKALRGKIADLEFEARDAEGAIGDLARAMPSLGSLSHSDGSFAERTNAYRQNLEQLLLRREVAPYLEQRGTEMSASLGQRIQEIQNHGEVNGGGRLPGEQDALDHTAKKVLLHEWALALATPLEKRQAAVKAATEEIAAAQNRAAEARTNGDDESANSWDVRVAELERAKHVLVAAARADATSQSVLDAAMAHPLDDASISEVARIADTMRIAGDMWRSQREDRGWLGVAGDSADSLDGIMNQVQEGTAKAVETAKGAVDQVIETSISLDLQARNEANAMLRRHTSRAQGMINQLMQLLRMQRSG